MVGAKKTVRGMKARSKSHKAIKSAKASPKLKKAPKPSLKTPPIKKKINIFSKNFNMDKVKPLVPQLPERKPTEAQKEDLKQVSKILADSNIRQSLIELGGENALAIIRNFFGNHSDEELAKRLKLKISDVRATLNRLHNEGLVNYIREKDNETGWYSYSWSLNIQRMERWVTTQNAVLGGGMRGSGTDELYFCPSCGAASITNFETASNWSFRCERCDRLLDFLDDKKMNELYEKRK